MTVATRSGHYHNCLFDQDYNDYDPNDIPEDQAAPAPSGYSYPAPENPLTLPRRGRKQSMKMMKHSMMMKPSQSKSMMSQKHKMMSKMSHDDMESRRQPRRFTSKEKSTNDRILAARRQGRQIMSVREWLRRGK